MNVGEGRNLRRCHLAVMVGGVRPSDSQGSQFHYAHAQPRNTGRYPRWSRASTETQVDRPADSGDVILVRDVNRGAKIPAVCDHDQVRDAPIIVRLKVGFVMRSRSPSKDGLALTTWFRTSIDGLRCIRGWSGRIDNDCLSQPPDSGVLPGVTNDVPQALRVSTWLPSSSACRQRHIPNAKMRHTPLLAGRTSSRRPRGPRLSDSVKRSLAMFPDAAP